jgi:hypothetical protein
MSTIYKFNFKCQHCDVRTNYRYRVPDEMATWTRLACKNCELPILSIYIDTKGPVYRCSSYYKLYNLLRKRYILGDDEDGVPRDTFWGWVVDHGGDRFGD